MSETQEQSNYPRTLDLFDEQGQYTDKIHKCPQITHFIVMLNSTLRRDQRVRHYLAASHLSESNGSFTLSVRIDVNIW